MCEWRLLQCIALFTIIKSLLPSKSNSLSIFQSFEFIIFHWPPGPPGCKCRRRRHPRGATIAAPPATLAPMRRGGGSSQPRRSWKKSRARTWSDIWKKKGYTARNMARNFRHAIHNSNNNKKYEMLKIDQVGYVRTQIRILFILVLTLLRPGEGWFFLW